MTGPNGAARASLGPTLDVRDLSVEFRTPDGPLPAVRNLSFSIRSGEVLGIVGESGCGKSSAALALLGLLARPEGRVLSGSANWNGRDLLRLDEAALRRVRGREIGMVFQDPLTALHPALPVVDQIAEAVRAHTPQVHRSEARGRATRQLRSVGIPPEAIDSLVYPHQWSGGMRQRAMIALATIHDPGLLIADEPTTALDVRTQARILRLLREASGAARALMLITHDLGVIGELADRVAVMYAGRLVETARVDELFTRPRHPYTAALLASRPGAVQGTVPALGGRPPDPRDLPTGCEFRPRCFLSRGRDLCLERPGLKAPDGAGDSRSLAACHFSDEIAATDHSPGARTRVADPVAYQSRKGPPLLALENVSVRYDLSGSGSRGTRPPIRAVESVSLDVNPAEVLALVGASGCGKSSLARAIVGLEPLAAGRVCWRDRVLASDGQRTAEVRRDIQIVFQDPYASLNPRRTVGATLALGPRIHGEAVTSERAMDAATLLERVGLDPSISLRYPHELSGGQRQRVAIARALSVAPRLLVLDEPVTSLDVSVQAQILNLLDSLRAETGLAMLLIAHDLSLVRAVADRVSVMDLGRIVETGPADHLFDHPSHPCTRALLAAVSGRIA